MINLLLYLSKPEPTPLLTIVMGITNVRSGRDLTQRAGRQDYEGLAWIPNCGQQVHIVAKSFDQEDIQPYKKSHP